MNFNQIKIKAYMNFSPVKNKQNTKIGKNNFLKTKDLLRMDEKTIYTAKKGGWVCLLPHPNAEKSLGC